MADKFTANDRTSTIVDKINPEQQLTDYRLFYLLIVFFLTLVIFTSANGQPNTNTPIGSNVQTKSTTTIRPKLVKTQGSKIGDNIRCALQDKAGNIWFGTTGEGVYRYNGKNFIQFTTKDGLKSNGVYSILEDRSGNIWFGTTDGLCRYNAILNNKAGQKNTIIPVPISGNFLPSLSNNDFYNDVSKRETVWSMLQDKNGVIWLGTGEGVYCYNGKTFTRFLDNRTIINKDGLQLKMVDDLLEDKNGNIWFASGMPPGMEGLCRFDGKTLTSFKPFGEKWIRYLLEDNSGTIWLGTRNQGVMKYDGENFTKVAVKASIAISGYIDKSGAIWFSGGEDKNGYGGENGIWRYDGKSFTNFTTKDGLGNYSVNSFLEDKDGNLWIGTRNTGLYRFNGKTFTCFSE